MTVTISQLSQSLSWLSACETLRQTTGLCAMVSGPVKGDFSAALTRWCHDTSLARWSVLAHWHVPMYHLIKLTLNWANPGLSHHVSCQSGEVGQAIWPQAQRQEDKSIDQDNKIKRQKYNTPLRCGHWSHQRVFAIQPQILFRVPLVIQFNQHGGGQDVSAQ